MQAVREIATGKVLYLFDNNKKVTITQAGLVTPLRALDIKPDTHDVVEAPLPPVDCVGGKLAFDGVLWSILDQQHYDDLAAKRVRAKRDKLLVECDWVVIRAKELGQDVPREWFDYRSDLRNVPQQDGFPHDVVWPTHPDDAAQDEPAP